MYEKNLKKSQFNIYIEQIENKYIVFNNSSLSMIELRKDIFYSLKNDKINEIDLKTLKELKKGNFVVNSELNEVDKLLQIRETLIRRRHSFGLQICPTFACNFNCSYCYQKTKFPGKYMSNEIMNYIIEYIKAFSKSSTKRIDVFWYGGEPLLAIDIIDNLSKNIISFCNNHDIIYFSGISTNGYLLNKERIKLLLKNKIEFFQITVDGPKEIHDKRRKLLNDKGTYDRIIKNIYTLLNEGGYVFVRINIDKDNINFISQLINEFENKKFFSFEKFEIGASRVAKYGYVCNKAKEKIIEDNEIDHYEDIYGINKMMENYSHPVLPKIDLFGCLALSELTFGVDPEGNIYKCDRLVGEEKEYCGNIKDSLFKKSHNYTKWQDYDKFKDEECINCSMLPVCGGKICPYELVIQKKKVGLCNKADKEKRFIENLKKLYLKQKKGGTL